MAELDLTVPPKPGAEVAVIVAATPALMFSDPDLPEKLFAEIEREIAAAKPDLSTATGRKAIASLAYKVAETKTAVDKAGLALTEGWRKQTTQVNAERTAFKAKLESLQAKARKPLDEWEAIERARETRAMAILADLRGAASIALGETAAGVRARYMALKSAPLDVATLGDHAVIGQGLLSAALEALEAGYARLVREEADRKELERLQAAEAARVKAAEEAKAAAEAADIAKRDAELAEEKRRAIEAAAADAARAEERAAAQREIDAANAETERLRKEAADKAALERVAEAGRVAREADEAHRAEVVEAAAVAIASLHAGVTPKKAREIAGNIAAGLVPGVKMEFLLHRPKPS